MNYIVGDIHGNWDTFSRFLKSYSPENVFVCGDFGYWPNTSTWDKFLHVEKIPDVLKNIGTKLYWCDGNHEDFNMLFGQHNVNHKQPIEIAKNTFYMPRGTVFEFQNKKVLFMGGALSIDRHYRIENHTWFNEELITQSNILSLKDDMEIDWVISHTCPTEFIEIDAKLWSKLQDPSRNALSYILQQYQPVKWFFGHFHFPMTGIYQNCEWKALADIHHNSGVAAWQVRI